MPSGLALLLLTAIGLTLIACSARAQDTPATFNSGPVVWNEGGAATFAIDKADGTSGVNWSRNNVTGTLTFASGYTAASTFTINLESVLYGGDGMDTGAPGAITNFDPSKDYTWTFVHTTGGMVGYDPSKVTIDSSQFQTYNSIQSATANGNQNGGVLPHPTQWRQRSGDQLRKWGRTPRTRNGSADTARLRFRRIRGGSRAATARQQTFRRAASRLDALTRLPAPPCTPLSVP